MKKQLTTSQKALALLTPIPSTDFIVDVYTNGNDKCCAIGHLVRLQSKDPSDFRHNNCNDNKDDLRKVSLIRELSANFLGNHGIDISSVNNKSNSKYKQKNPKSRVVALLKDMIKEGL